VLGFGPASTQSARPAVIPPVVSAVVPTIISAVIVEIAETVETALQRFGAIALLLGDFAPRHKTAPAEVRRRIIGPRRTAKAATKALVGLRLDNCDPRIDLARGPLAFDIAAAVTAVELEREPAIAVEPKRLGYGCPANESEDCGDNNSIENAHAWRSGCDW
jgi:hypothetical protein